MAKNRYTLKITVNVVVESDLELEEVIDEFGSESDYNFLSTDNVTVTGQEWVDTEYI